MKVDPKDGIPTLQSTSEYWQQWHQSLKSAYGRAQANSLFLKAWSIRGNKNDDSNLRSYLKKNGITLTTGVVGKAEDYASDVFDSIGDALSIGKYAGIGIMVIGVGLVSLLIFNIAKNPIGTLKAAR